MGLRILEWLESMSLIQITENKELYKLHTHTHTHTHTKSQIGTNWDGLCVLHGER